VFHKSVERRISQSSTRIPEAREGTRGDKTRDRRTSMAAAAAAVARAFRRRGCRGGGGGLGWGARAGKGHPKSHCALASAGILQIQARSDGGSTLRAAMTPLERTGRHRDTSNQETRVQRAAYSCSYLVDGFLALGTRRHLLCLNLLSMYGVCGGCARGVRCGGGALALSTTRYLSCAEAQTLTPDVGAGVCGSAALDQPRRGVFKQNLSVGMPGRQIGTSAYLGLPLIIST
jgi:hypothetical protein